jgi:hypothetical protein
MKETDNISENMQKRDKKTKRKATEAEQQEKRWKKAKIMLTECWQKKF